MDILDLSEEIKNFKYNGVTLNLDERVQLELALNKLQTQVNAEELLFWGKINGITNDYFIAVAYNFSGRYEFPHKQFYWALSTDYNFQIFTDLNDQHKLFVDSDLSLFEGNPKKKLLSVKKEGEEEEGGAPEEIPEEGQEEGQKQENQSDLSEEEEIKVPPKDLTGNFINIILKYDIELDRLVYVVLAIENDCQIIPNGAFKLTPTHQVRRNEAFKGLKKEESVDANNYQHFRNVQFDDIKSNLDLPNAPFNTRFLDPINRDKPSGCWAFQKDSNEKIVVGRSLGWPGSFFYHKIGSKKFGNIYIGDGHKNHELQFMIN